MSRPKFVQARITSLKAGISAAESSEIVLKKLVDLYGNALSMSDFGDTMYLTINPGSENEEIISATGFTVNSDNSVSIDTGIVRGLLGVSGYGTGGTASDHSAGNVVVVSNNPQIYEATLDYIDGVAIAGASDASTETAGISEEATTAEIDADTGEGTTTRRTFVNPERLATSKYGVRLPTTGEKAFLSVVTGMIMDYAGTTAPSGFLLCDGTAYSASTYADLAAVIKGRFGVATGTTFTADAGTDTLTATSHGYSNGNILFVSSTTTLPAGLSANTVYYVVGATTNTFQLSTTSGGSAIDITSAGSGTHTAYTQFNVPDLRGSASIGSGQKVKTFTFTDSDVNTGTDIITVSSNQFLYTGTAVALTTSGTLPTGLSATTYYVIRQSATTIKLATSVANANAGTAVDITGAAGGGTHTLTLTLTSRTVADAGGEETHALTDAEMPSHTHPLTTFTSASGANSKINSSSVDSSSSGSDLSIEVPDAGSDTVHNNMMPFVTVAKIIKT